MNYFAAAGFMPFLESVGEVWQNMMPASDDLQPRKSSGSLPNGLDGRAFMMRTPDRKLAMLYFENQCGIPAAQGFLLQTRYVLKWFDPIRGGWTDDANTVPSDADGMIRLEAFPDGRTRSAQDWALKLIASQ